MKQRRELPQGTRRCPPLHLSRGRRPWRCRRRRRSHPRRLPSRCRRSPRCQRRHPHRRFRCPPRRLRSLPCLRRQRFPMRHQCPRRRQSPHCPRWHRRRRLHCCHQSQCRSRRSKSFHRRPWTSSRRVRSRSCHLSRRSRLSQSSHLYRHRLSPSPSIRQQRKAGPTAKTVPSSLRPYATRRGLLWSRDSPSDRVAVSKYGQCRCGDVPSLSSGRSGSRDVLGDECRVPNVGHQLCAGRVRVNPVARVLRIWKVAGLRQRGPDVDHVDR